MWSFLVEFRSVSSLGSWQKKKEEEDKIIAVKPKSTDDYVERPNDINQS